MKNKIMQLHKSVAPFAKTNTKKSLRQIFNTIPPFFLCWFLAYKSMTISLILTIGFAILASGFVVRTFILFHDCTHRSFFKSKRANDVLGTMTGIITHFPYKKWKHEHAIHHATSSNLDKRGVGDIWVMTVNEYIEAPFWRKVAYRLYRNPFILFVLGPFYLFFVSNRFNREGANWNERLNTYVTNGAIVGVYAVLISFLGWSAVLLIQGIVMFVSGSAGIWLFYVQHQFEDSYFENEPEWHFVKAAVEGSSYYKLSTVLQWITGNIGYHHVHHLSPRVPNYYLEAAHNSTPPLQEATTITLRSSLKSLRFRLYDPDNKGFVTFKDVKSFVKKPKVERNQVKSESH